VIQEDKDRVTLSIPRLTQNHPALVNRVLRLAIARIKNDLKRITLTHIEDIHTLMARSESGKSLDLPGQIRVYKIREHLNIQKEVIPLRELGRAQKRFRRGATKDSKGKD